VVKIGGAALADTGWLHAFAAHAAAAREPLVIVHGGGPEISALSERLAIPVEWVNGKRITPPAALDAASMVLNGRVNKRIVRVLLDTGADALGLSGEDGGLVTAQLAAGGALGRVGAVAAVRTELLEWLLAKGIIPVVAPLARGSDGAALNVNADEVAAAVAVALQAVELLFVTDVSGVRDDAGGTCDRLSAGRAHELLAAGTVSGGMAVKLTAALEALARGVSRIRIGDVRALDDATVGTRVHAGVAEVVA
jgi:acetylglutamate kinase